MSTLPVARTVERQATLSALSQLRRLFWSSPLIWTFGIILFVSLAGAAGTQFLVPLFGWGWGVEAIDAPGGWLTHFARWDAGYYLRIAQTGYRIDGPERAFFPLYPLVARAVAALFGLSIFWSGWLVSLGAFFGATALLYRFIQLDYGVIVARRAVLWFCCTPVSFFFVAFYPESLFLLLSIASLYFARRGQFLLGGLMIGLAGATRPTAFLLAVPYLVEFVLQRDFRRSRWLQWAGGAALAPLGTLAYLIFLSQQTASANPVTIYNENLANNWETETTWPWTTFAHGIQSALFGSDIGTDWFSRIIVWQDLLAAVFGVAIAIWSLRNLRPSYSLLLVASLLFFTTSHGPSGYVFESMPRHIASIVPLYMGIAVLFGRLPLAVRRTLLTLSLIFLGLFSAWFASGRWVS